MVQKRNFTHRGDDGSENPAPQASKRLHSFPKFITDLKGGSSLQELAPKLEPFFRRLVREEVENAIRSSLRSPLNQIEPSRSSAFHLHINDKFPTTIFTFSKIESEGSKPVEIVLYDAYSKRRITSGPMSSVKINLVVIDGDFSPDDREDWTEQEFNNKVVHERDGKRPLLTGDLVIQLKNGMGHIGDINFTDNSSWIRSRKFRLGVKIICNSGEQRVREGISKAFTVKDHRGESYRKHYPPSLHDEVWRLEKVAKDGASHKKLTDIGISSVKCFLRMYTTNPSDLRQILGYGMSNNTWEKIIEHATTCVVDDNEWYMYKVAESIVLVFNSIFKIVGAILDGQNYQPLDRLNIFQMRMVEDLKQCAYRNLKDFVLVEDHSIICNPMVMPNPQVGLSISPSSSQETFNFPVEQDQLEMQMYSDHTTISPPSYELQQSPFGVSMPESSHRMGSSSSSSCFLINNPSAVYAGDVWGPSGSQDPLIITTTPSNYQLESPLAWPGNNGLSATSSTERASPSFGINSSKTGKPRARWCKIRAVVKLTILVKKRKWHV
ncbi:calmodulin-binding protein 60 B-like [Ipomoea triloba]|uniref:calmodulin-binding protein 60 B-like n=1 Tax=Ipomoea triloba TaxID=35885 RepID=UPI00125E2FE3|nr:calmodulin-binding protein 60 B-like [Ipomoea triloba]